ncbi:MAG TPA: hypothetical protein VE008_07435 [Burkholderiales bacterium]|nr:hypothetical protein [Burkholderiales bacterium]
MDVNRVSWIGVPEMFELNAACQLIRRAFDAGVYLVGSSLHKRDYRDVDVRCIVTDAKFAGLFGELREPYQHDAYWSLLSITISHWLRLRTGLPVDFQIQPMTEANAKYPNEQRNALGLYLASRSQ